MRDNPHSPGPTGQGDHVVKQGDCIASIALESGHFWKTIWTDSANRELRRVRQDPNMLLPGDRVTIPPFRVKEESGQTNQRHTFLRRGVPEMLRIRLVDQFGDSRRNLSYIIEIEGKMRRGMTDDDGLLDEPIPPNSHDGRLILGEEQDEEITLQLGQLNPATEVTGIQARLENLGFDCGPIDGDLGPRTREAIKEFQSLHDDLTPTGDLDEASLDRLKADHGS